MHVLSRGSLMCTNLSLFSASAKQPYVISARTMDFAVDLATQVSVVPRGQSFPELTPAQFPLTWTNKFGYVGMLSSLEGCEGISDGLNEAGLSIGALWLACSDYPVAGTASAPAIYNGNVADWVLGNFDSVAALKDRLNSVTVVNLSEINSEMRVLLHFVVQDATGAAMIIEFVNGQMQTYDTDNGVMTNAPPYPYHTDNMTNYVNLSLSNNAAEFWGQQLNGSGCLGMPGDYSAPSRFVRAWMLQQSTQNFTPNTTEEAVGLAARILQNFATPMGAVVTDSESAPLDYTQWGVIRDQKERVYYFFSQFNNGLFAVDLKKIDFATAKPAVLQVIQPQWVTDLTAELLV